MPQVQNAKSLSETCIDFIGETQDNFCNNMPLSELEDGVLEAIESEKCVVNRFDGLRKLLNVSHELKFSFLPFNK
jgi:hypothetical protein